VAKIRRNISSPKTTSAAKALTLDRGMRESPEIQRANHESIPKRPQASEVDAKAVQSPIRGSTKAKNPLSQGGKCENQET
jgi:hypothetical protein